MALGSQQMHRPGLLRRPSTPSAPSPGSRALQRRVTSSGSLSSLAPGDQQLPSERGVAAQALPLSSEAARLLDSVASRASAATEATPAPLPQGSGAHESLLHSGVSQFWSLLDVVRAHPALPCTNGPSRWLCTCHLP